MFSVRQLPPLPPSYRKRLHCLLTSGITSLFEHWDREAAQRGPAIWRASCNQNPRAVEHERVRRRTRLESFRELSVPLNQHLLRFGQPQLFGVVRLAYDDVNRPITNLIAP